MKGIYNVSKKPNSCWTKKQGNWASKGNFKKTLGIRKYQIESKRTPTPPQPPGKNDEVRSHLLHNSLRTATKESDPESLPTSR